MTQPSAVAGFKREALPQDIEPYRQEAAKNDQTSFEKLVPYPFLLYVRSKLWDKSLLVARGHGGDDAGATRMVRYEFYEGGYTFLHPVRKRQTNPGDAAIILGRSTSQDLIVPVPSISNSHLAFLPPTAGARPLWHVKDNGSSNGSWLNDTKLEPLKPYPIQDNEYLRLGGNLIAWFLYPGHLWFLLNNDDELKKLTDV
ncbi:MAG: FHA domain-containing protein [Deltaproteobacteria bacterium]|nr:FHA domain-containing protein [Deltaproteobacteria bacterium]